LFKLPPVAPQKFTPIGEYAKLNPDSLILTETGFLRFARDYGFMPFVCPQAQLREFYANSNRKKIIVSSRLPTREQMDNKPHSAAQLDKVNRQTK
jgi:hypothetical protein